MEKYEFSTKQPWWEWAMIVIMVGFMAVFGWTTGKYELVVIWLGYAVINFMLHKFTYVITPDAFVLNPLLGRKREFLLKDITEIERKFSKGSKLSSIVVRYKQDKMYHNFFEIRGSQVNVRAVLDAVLDYCPSVPVR